MAIPKATLACKAGDTGAGQANPYILAFWRGRPITGGAYTFVHLLPPSLLYSSDGDTVRLQRRGWPSNFCTALYGDSATPAQCACSLYGALSLEPPIAVKARRSCNHAVVVH